MIMAAFEDVMFIILLRMLLFSSLHKILLKLVSLLFLS
jgi:hypothetical protein